jgi:two-component system OmpR family sensor kinase
MLTSLRARLLGTYVLLIGAVLALAGMGLILLLLRNPIPERQTALRLELVASVLVERDARPGALAEPARLQPLLARLGLADGRVLILAADGQVLGDSLPEGPALRDPARLDTTDTGQQIIRDASGRAWLAVVHPLPGGRRVVVAAPRPLLRGLLVLGDDLLRPLLQAAGLALVLSTLLAWLVSRSVAGPLQRMGAAARAVAEGDYQTQLQPGGPAEVRQLAAAFNDMVRHVQASRQSQRDFVANVSHELKTPLTSIQGFAQAILDGTASEPASRRHAAEVIYDEADRLRRMVEDLLDLARLDAGQAALSFAVVDLPMLLETVGERFDPPAREKGVGLSQHSEGLPPLVADGDRLAQVFTNLIDNALKHTPPGGQVRVVGHAAGDWITVQVEDTGEGIPPDKLTRIFERFYQADRSRRGGAGRGVGLGLAISREILAAHGGTLTAESTPGAGSCFTVRLPRARSTDSTVTRRKRHHRRELS